MLNYNLNINSPLQQEKKNENVRPPIYWTFESYASSSDSSDLGELGFATMSINAPLTNCIEVSNDSGNDFATDAQYPVTASITGSNWPITGSTTMSIYTAGITYDPASVNQYYLSAISASALDIYLNPSYTGSILKNSFSASEFFRFYVEGRVYHTKGNVFNPLINWIAKNESPSTTNGNVNGFTASFNIVKDSNIQLVSVPEVTGSKNASFNNQYALNITSSLSASILNDTTGSTTMSISISEAGILTSSLLFNSSSAGLQTISASFVAANNNPYNITASVIFNKGNIWNSNVNWLITGSNSDSYSIYTIPSNFRLLKDINVDGSIINQNVLILDYGMTSSISGQYQTQYAFNFQNDITESGTYPIYQVHTFPTTSLNLTPAGTSSVRYDSGSIISYTEFPYTSSYNLTASAWINKIPALEVSIIAIGGGGGGGRGTATGGAGYNAAGGGGGAAGFIQWTVSMLPNKLYTINTIGTAGTGSSTTSGQNGSNTNLTIYLGPTSENPTASLVAGGGFGGVGSTYNGAGGASGTGYVQYISASQDIYLYLKDSVNGGAGATNDRAGGGGGITNTGIAGDQANGGNGGLNLGGGGGGYQANLGGTGSIAPTIFFHSSSFTWTGSGGNGGSAGTLTNGQNATALGGGGGGAYGPSTGTHTGGNGMGGCVILAHTGSEQKLTVPEGTITTFSNGVLWYLIKNTGSFSYNVEPKPNPEQQNYIWRAETLVIAGGGAGGNDNGGGGGAGGYSYNPYVWYNKNKTYSVTIGAGAASKTLNNSPFSGSDSYIVDSDNNTLILTRGGGNGFAQDGGSGGGAQNAGNGGTTLSGKINYFLYVTSSQANGFGGGAADGVFFGGGGGGGAANSGSNGSGGSGGNGGIGKYTLDFIPIGVCGGGNGESNGTGQNVTIFGGGKGGFAPANTGSNATSFGSGGGGAEGVGQSTGAGGNGLVQIRYAGFQRATGGQIQTALISGSYYTLHTFTASGTFSPYE